MYQISKNITGNCCSDDDITNGMPNKTQFDAFQMPLSRISILFPLKERNNFLREPLSHFPEIAMCFLLICLGHKKLYFWIYQKPLIPNKPQVQVMPLW